MLSAQDDGLEDSSTSSLASEDDFDNEYCRFCGKMNQMLNNKKKRKHPKTRMRR